MTEIPDHLRQRAQAAREAAEASLPSMSKLGKMSDDLRGLTTSYLRVRKDSSDDLAIELSLSKAHIAALHKQRKTFAGDLMVTGIDEYFLVVDDDLIDALRVIRDALPPEIPVINTGEIWQGSDGKNYIIRGADENHVWYGATLPETYEPGHVMPIMRFVTEFTKLESVG